MRSSIYFVPEGPGVIPFAKMVYDKQCIPTGSSVNVKGFSALAGLAFNTNFNNGSQLVVALSLKVAGAITTAATSAKALAVV